MINSMVAEPSGFNSCKGVIEIGSGFNSRRRKPCFESHSTTLFQASWLSFEAFTSLMKIGFLYYNCLGFDLTSDYTDIVLNTV